MHVKSGDVFLNGRDPWSVAWKAVKNAAATIPAEKAGIAKKILADSNEAYGMLKVIQLLEAIERRAELPPEAWNDDGCGKQEFSEIGKITGACRKLLNHDGECWFVQVRDV